ncbi:MAG: hypothetical protein BWX84_02370 [Verrucomicrobia bacterium ADurb.Bin118]|nr:MAG: hypothetical protein BWX84_02370 [Verrucomicrobia bacterium ADurb.Bin118]
MNWSKNGSSTNTSFSPMQSRLLSHAAPATTHWAALSRQLVPSTNTGGLPGPAHTARLPLAIAAFTTPGPPVTQSNRTFSFRAMASNDSSVGGSMMLARFSMPSSR